LKYQFAIDIHVISTLDGAANDPAGSALERKTAAIAIHLRLIRRSSMGVAWFSGWDVIVRTLVAGSVTYLALVLLLRVSGPRMLAKWYAFDLIVTVAPGSTFANCIRRACCES